VVHQLYFAAAQNRDHLARDPLATGVGIPAGEIHELPVGVANRRMDVEQHLALRRALAPLLVLRQREKAVRDAEAKPTRAEVHADPDSGLVIGEHVDIVIAAADGAELLARLGAQAIAL